MTRGFKRLLCLCLCLCLLLGVLPTGTRAAEPLSFTDVSRDDWFYEAVDTVANDHRLMNGFEDGSFRPDTSLTREQFVKVLAMVARVQPQTYAQTDIHAVFTDVPNDDWFTPYVAWAYAEGITNGVDADRFGVEEPVTREQVAKFLVSFSGQYGYQLPDSDQFVCYADTGDVSDWAVPYVELVRKTALFRGDENACFNPDKPISRAEIAAVLVRLMEMFARSEGDNFYICGVEAAEDGTVTVIGCAGRPSILRVELRDDDDEQVLASAEITAFTACRQQELTLQLDPEILADTQYYVLRAQLFDEDGEPRCDPYENLHRTRTYEAFASKTEADFEPDLVIDFDDKGSDNFAVLQPEVRDYLDDASVSAELLDGQTGEYRLNGAPLPAAGDRLIVRVNGSTRYLAVVDSDADSGTFLAVESTELGDFFEYIRIDLDSISAEPAKRALAEKTIPIAPISGKANVGPVALEGEFSGGVTIHFCLEYDVHLIKGGSYFLCEYWIQLDYSVNAEIKGEFDKTGTDAVNLIPPVGISTDWLPSDIKDLMDIEINVGVVASFSVAGGIGIESTGTMRSGFVFDTRNGTWLQKIDDKEGTVTPVVKAEGELTVGPRAIAAATFGKFVHASAELIGGVNVNAELDITAGKVESNAPSYHACDVCLSTEAYLSVKYTVEYNVSVSFVKEADKFELETPHFGELKGHLSLKNDPQSIYQGKITFGEGVCKNQLYRVKYIAKDGNGKPVDAEIRTVDCKGAPQTLSAGGFNYLYPGSYTAATTIDGEEVEQAFTVNDGPATVELKAKQIQLFIRVTDKKDRPIDGASLQLEGKGVCRYRGTKDLGGVTYRWYSVEKGNWTVTAEAENYMPASEERSVQSDSTITLRLEEAGWAKAYADWLATAYSGTKFALAYIDDDDIPELLAPAAAMHSAQVMILTYYNGELVELGGFGDYGTTEISVRNGMIIKGNFINGGFSYTYFYRLANGQVTLLKKFYSDASSTDIKYEVDDKSVTKASYDAQAKAMRDPYTWTTFSHYQGAANNASNRKALQEDYTQFLFP